MIRTILASALVLTSLASAAQSRAAVSDSAGAPAAAKPNAADRVICKDIEEIGSRLARKRICMTALQWKEQQEMDRDNAADQQQRATIPQVI
jgi:hypothetical protein